jgi:type I protein arginine methyltransferase
MADSLTRLPGRLVQRLFRAAFPVVRKLYYDVANQFGFGDLYIHEMMLADRVRVDAYNDAIKQHVCAGDVVVDLGTGSGILAFLAAAQKPRKVYAIDHSSITELASMVMDDNGIDNVEILKVNSRKLRLPEKVDVIIHEQMGHALFDERMVLNVTDLRDRVLKPGGKILPARFDLYLDPVQVKDDHFVPFAWEQTIHGVRFVALRRLKGSMAPDYLFKELHQWEYSRFLCDSVPVLSFDLTTLDVADLPSAFESSRAVTTAGRLDGLAVHFVARFDDEISISTSPFSPRTCWRVPLLRMESRAYEVGERVAIKVAAPDLSNVRTWTWSVTPDQGASR